jgi:hypothetical protein
VAQGLFEAVGFLGNQPLISVAVIVLLIVGILGSFGSSSSASKKKGRRFQQMFTEDDSQKEKSKHKHKKQSYAQLEETVSAERINHYEIAQGGFG